MHQNGSSKNEDKAAPPALDVQNTAEALRVVKELEKDLSDEAAEERIAVLAAEKGPEKPAAPAGKDPGK